jgi:murein DD-endopeptidase MepM/ murein hydrolase activator NlpD
MKQHYFVVVLAHSLHGRLRRIHIPHQALYVLLGLALFGSFSLFGMVSSYLRMTWKVANYNTLRTEVDTLRHEYKALQQENGQKDAQLAELQLLASEVTLALGLKRAVDSSSDFEDEGLLVPTFRESIDQYNWLKFANISRIQRSYPRAWQKNTIPAIWPVNGRILSHYGDRQDPFSGEGAFHSGLDISAVQGTSVRASADGVVEHAEWASGGYGKLVVIDHGNGIQTWYAHLSGFEVVSGQEIRRGDILGYSGATGRVTSPHLHFEVRRQGNPVNPYPYLAKSTLVEPAPPDLPF